MASVRALLRGHSHEAEVSRGRPTRIVGVEYVREGDVAGGGGEVAGEGHVRFEHDRDCGACDVYDAEAVEYAFGD